MPATTQVSFHPANILSRRQVMGHTRLRPRRRNSNIQRPSLPTHLLLTRFPGQPTKPHPSTGTTAFLLVELDRYPAAHATAFSTPSAGTSCGGREMLADEGGNAGVDEGFEVDVVDGGEGEVEDVESGRADGGEVTVEEDEV